MHEFLQEKFYGWEDAPVCPRCGSDKRDLEVSEPRVARGRRLAHGGKIGFRCQNCKHFQPMVLARHKAL
jgi:transposase-like protein